MLAELIRKKLNANRERWIKEAENNGSARLIIGYDCMSRTNFPIYDKVCNNIYEIYKRYFTVWNYFLIDVIKIEKQIEKVTPEKL